MNSPSRLDECRQEFTAAKSGKKNYYQYLSLPVTATQQEIETSLARKRELLNSIKVQDGDLAVQMAGLINRIQTVLLDYQERARYDGRGFREFSPEDVAEPEPDTQAKDIYQKAKSLYAQKRYRDCFLAMSQALKLDSSKPGYYLLMGLTQSNMVEFRRDAEINLTKASEMEPWNAEPLVALGILFYREKLLKRADVYFKRALELEPNHSVARKYHDELVGPVDGLADKVIGVLSKVMPTFFKKR
jgi:tetratricopeptide (TPR) repeat protein